MNNLNDHSQRGHALLSASSAHRWLECPPSAVAAAGYPDEATEFAQEGTLAHEVAEAVASMEFVRRGERKPLGEIFKNTGEGYRDDVTHEMIECATSYRDYIQEQLKSEHAVVLLEQRVDFSPWVPGGFGTCDCIIIQDDVLTIIDYKYGKGVAVSAEGNPQMKLYALGALNEFGFAYDIIRVEMHIYQPRMNNISDCSLMVEDLLEWGEQIKPIAQKAAKGKGTYKPGEHCRFCPHAGRCRALTKVCTEYVETHGMRVAVPVLAPHEIADVLAMEPLVSLWLKRVKAQALTSMLDGEEVPGWKVVEGKLGNRKWTDELQVAAALDAAGYAREDYIETKLLGPASMDKLLGKKKAAEVLAGLTSREAGAPTIVPATDKRPAYNRLEQAQKDFE